MTPGSDPCRRLEDALCDGRFREDPALWREHVEACASCRAKVEGLFTAEDLFGRAAEEARVFDPDPDRSRRAIEAALRRYASHRRNTRVTGACVALGLAILLGVALLKPSSDPEPLDSTAYARRLKERVFPKGGAPRYDLLKSDAGLRQEYLAALDHGSSLVRRTALWALLSSGVELPPERLAAILGGWKEDLEAPLAVASGRPDAGQVLEAAIESRRYETLRHLLSGVQILRSQGKKGIPPSLITPYLVHPDDDVRTRAILALHFDRDYHAGDEVAHVMESDPLPAARVLAAQCLMERSGEEGAQRVVEYLRSKGDDEVEYSCATKLATFGVGLAFARERIRGPTTSTRSAIAHAHALFRSGDRQPPRDVFDRALSDEDVRGCIALAALCHEAGWDEYRSQLQRRWRALSPSNSRTQLASALLTWDLAKGTEETLGWALEILRADDGSRLKHRLEQLAGRKDTEAGRSAARLLEERSRGSRERGDGR